MYICILIHFLHLIAIHKGSMLDFGGVLNVLVNLLQALKPLTFKPGVFTEGPGRVKHRLLVPQQTTGKWEDMSIYIYTNPQKDKTL